MDLKHEMYSWVLGSSMKFFLTLLQEKISKSAAVRVSGFPMEILASLTNFYFVTWSFKSDLIKLLSQRRWSVVRIPKVFQKRKPKIWNVKKRCLELWPTERKFGKYYIRTGIHDNRSAANWSGQQREPNELHTGKIFDLTGVYTFPVVVTKFYKYFFSEYSIHQRHPRLFSADKCSEALNHLRNFDLVLKKIYSFLRWNFLTPEN